MSPYAEALYQLPPPEGTPKSCGHCAFFVKPALDEQPGGCLVHPRSEPVEASMVCKFWVYGQARQARVDLGTRPTTRRESGLCESADWIFG